MTVELKVVVKFDWDEIAFFIPLIDYAKTVQYDVDKDLDWHLAVFPEIFHEVIREEMKFYININ